MKSGKDIIKDTFASKLNGFEPELPPSLWERIEADLDSKQTLIPLKSKKSNIGGYIQWFSIAAAIIVAVLIFYPKNEAITNDNLEALIEIKKTNFTLAKKDNETEIKGNTKFEDANEQPQIFRKEELYSQTSKKEQERVNFNTQENILDTDAKLDDSSNFEDEMQVVEDDPSPQHKEKTSKSESSLTDKNKNREDLLAYGPTLEEVESKYYSNLKHKKSSSSNNLELGLGGSSGFSKSNDMQMQLRRTLLANTTENQLTASYTQQTVKLHHSLPISFGFTLNKSITNKVSLESGIVYTYLASKARSITGSEYKLRDSQHFHYLGIPLTVNYKLGEWKKVKFYTSAGAMIQKDIYGRMNTVQAIAGMEETRELIKRNISQDNPQFSLLASFRATYPIYKKLSLYGNIGGSYYFDANNNYEIIYSDKKWLLNLNLGINLGF